MTLGLHYPPLWRTHQMTQTGSRSWAANTRSVLIPSILGHYVMLLGRNVPKIFNFSIFCLSILHRPWFLWKCQWNIYEARLVPVSCTLEYTQLQVCTVLTLNTDATSVWETYKLNIKNRTYICWLNFFLPLVPVSHQRWPISEPNSTSTRVGSAKIMPVVTHPTTNF